MIPRNRVPTHPGEILFEEFLKPLGITQTAFARHLGVPLRRINEIIKGKRAISPETAQLFSASLRTSPQFWMNAQIGYDLATHHIRTDVKPLVKAG